MRVMIRNARIAFPNLFQAKGFNGSEPKFGCTLLIDKNDPQIAKIKEAMVTVAKDKWAAKGEAQLKNLVAGQKVFLNDGDLKEVNGFAGNWALNTSNKNRPTVINKDKSQLDASDGLPYAGSYVDAQIDIWAMDNQYGKRICATVLAVQFKRDGEAFGGGAPADLDEFEAEAPSLGEGGDLFN